MFSSIPKTPKSGSSPAKEDPAEPDVNPLAFARLRPADGQRPHGAGAAGDPRTQRRGAAAAVVGVGAEVDLAAARRIAVAIGEAARAGWL